MEKTLRSALHSSPEEFLICASKLPLKSSKPLLKTLIHKIPPSSPLISSLPSSLHLSISQSINSFSQSDGPSSPPSPPSKRPRRRLSPDTSPPDPHRQTLLNSLRSYTYILRLCLSHPKKPFPPSDLLPSACALHDSLILFEWDPVLMLDIAGLCEEWWKEHLPWRETLISQSLPFLLSRSLTEGKKVDVRRVCALRDALLLLDFDDESIEDLKLLLVRCIITPLYLKTEEGRRFVASLFGLNLQLTKEALAMIRAQIPFGRKSILEAYGEVLFRGWKAADGELRGEIEDGFLQGLVEGAIHARSRSLAGSVRRVLGGFINQRTTDGVEKLLFRLVEPVLFRSLQAANSNVRQNALHLLLDMFPLEDPDATKDVKDTVLHKQFFLLERLLVDDCPDVRVVAVEGCFRILRLFWEVIPPSTISKMLAKLVDDMQYDSCTEVRLSTLNGVIYLLGNPQTHELLKVLLPRFGKMFVDPVLSIRVAVADLLLAVRDIRTFQFNKVVGLDTLLSSLAKDHSLVAKKLTRLLMPSYFPLKVSSKEACNRFIALIRRSPTAAARFCEFALSEGASLKSLMELVRVCVDFILSPDSLKFNHVDGLFAGAANICRNLSTESSSQIALNELFSENVDRQAEVRAAHKLMLSCDRFNALFEALANNLQEIASRFHEKFGLEMAKQYVPSVKRKKVRLSRKSSMKSSHSNGKGSMNSSMSSVEYELVVASMIAWQIKDLLVSVETRNSVLNSPMLNLVFSALKVIAQVNIEHCMHCESLDTSPVLAYAAVAMHISLQSVELTDTNDIGNEGTNGLQSTRPSLEQTTLDLMLNHLINCTEKLFHVSISAKSSNLCQGEEKIVNRRRSKRREALADVSNTAEDGAGDKTDPPVAKRISNTVKMATTVLKFIVDAASMQVVLNSHPKALRFASAFAQYIISSIENLPDHDSLFEEDLRETFNCIKSSFTYASKLLHLVLKNANESSPPSLETSHLTSNLLDLITSVEFHLGSKHAAYLIAVAKPWLPDLVLALSSWHILIKATKDGDLSVLPHYRMLHCSQWLTALCKIEFCELSEVNNDVRIDKVYDMKDFSMFRKLIEMVVLLLKKGNPKVLDAVGAIFLRTVMVGLERQDFGLVLGLLHFVCMKMVGREHESWEKLELMSASLQETYSQVEREIQNPSISEREKHELESAWSLLESVGVGHP
ncbi:hypothetical protein MRB53_012576 [Persea americana]|uniref:Uncharacterized protein n=1 Tax=Persea americana TaxID=3435 RepID=A0ACC2LZ50_PERAE|nr:hypothetical protein MRB53_012576 [Persea americana]